MTSECFIKNYVARDLLHLVFDNSDNHGRNISYLKKEGDINIAPIYDFAPMKPDPEMVTRLFKWERDCEQNGKVGFKKITIKLSDKCDPDELLGFLRMLTNRMLDLPEQLERQGCPEQIINFPAIEFRNTKNRLMKIKVPYA